MVKKIPISSFALSFCSGAFAEFAVGLGYYHITEDDIDVDVAMAGVTMGYKFGSDNSNSALVTELRAGVGVKDDSMFGVGVEIVQAYGLNVRGQWDIASNRSFFWCWPFWSSIQNAVI